MPLLRASCVRAACQFYHRNNLKALCETAPHCRSAIARPGLRALGPGAAALAVTVLRHEVSTPQAERPGPAGLSAHGSHVHWLRPASAAFVYAG
jgi:hypothetical protein